MESWRPESEESRRRPVMSVRNMMLALAAHLAVFGLFFAYSIVHGLFRDDDKIIPIDLTIVVNQNLDGKEDEPPPLDDPPPPPKPKPKPRNVVKKLDPPKALERMVTNIVTKVEEKDEKKDAPRQPEQKKEEQKKTAAELRAERLEAMRNRAKNTTKRPVEIKVKNPPSGDGRTDRKILSNAEIEQRLNAGYTPGRTTQLAKSDAQLGYSLIKRAFEAKWDTPPWTAELKPMTIRVWFGPGGKVLRYKLESSSGDLRADQSITTAASRVGTVFGLPAAFVEEYRSSGVPVRFTVRPQ